MIGAIEPTVAATGSQWVESVVVPIAVALVTSGVVVYVLQRRDAARSRRRDGYAEAVSAVVAWIEYPFRVRRRTSDDAETLTRLAGDAHLLQERLAYSLAWIAADNASTYDSYAELVESAKAEMGPLVKNAWDLPPVTCAGDMNLDGWAAAEAAASNDEVGRFYETIKKHFRGP